MRKVLCVEQLEIELSLDTKLVNGVGQNGFDLLSIGYAEFIVMMEQEFIFEFDFYTQIKTVGEIYSYFFKKKGRKMMKIEHYYLFHIDNRYYLHDYVMCSVIEVTGVLYGSLMEDRI